MKDRGKRSRKTPARYWIRYGVKVVVVIVRIIRIWLDMGGD